ncbi:unnamed protein product, partial [Notodromas monacha]
MSVIKSAAEKRARKSLAQFVMATCGSRPFLVLQILFHLFLSMRGATATRFFAERQEMRQNGQEGTTSTTLNPDSAPEIRPAIIKGIEVTNRKGFEHTARIQVKTSKLRWITDQFEIRPHICYLRRITNDARLTLDEIAREVLEEPHA